MNYSQIQPEDRIALKCLKRQNYSIWAMARVLDRVASKISRELRRNSLDGHYESAQKQLDAIAVEINKRPRKEPLCKTNAACL